MLKPGICSVTFRDESPESVIQLTADAGLKGIEWGADVHVPLLDLENARKVGEQTRAAGLEVAGYGSYFLAFDKEGESPAPFTPVLEAAQALGAPVIRIWGGSMSMEKTDDYFETVVQLSREAAEMAGEKGIQVAYEFHRNTFTETLEGALRLLEKVDHPNMRIYWQPQNGTDLQQRLQQIEALRNHLLNVHVFHWGNTPKPPFPRHSLDEGSDLWPPCLEAVAAIPGNRFALLEFVRENTVDQFRKDAQTLIGWLKAGSRP